MKKILLLALLISLIICSLYFTKILPIIIGNNIETINPKINQKDSIINPLKGIDTKQIDIYIHISNSDSELLPDGIPKAKLLHTRDSIIVRRFVNNFKFQHTGSDMATCESILYIYSDKELLFKSNIVIETDKVGLQSNYYGWLEAKNKDEIIKVLKDFKPVYQPIIHL